MLLNNLKDGELLHCISAFNGFAIYRTEQFKHCWYDGRIRLDLLPESYLSIHMKVTNSPIILKDYGNVNGYYEDCEHRAFHIQSIFQKRAKIRISPEVLFF
jgi:antirestriction protein